MLTVGGRGIPTGATGRFWVLRCRRLHLRKGPSYRYVVVAAASYSHRRRQLHGRWVGKGLLGSP